MNVKQGDVVLLPVPFSDQSARKVRPAVVVSNNSINSKSEDVILVPLTSVIKDVPYSTLITQQNLSEGKIDIISRARADKIFTADKSLIKVKLGTAKPNILINIKEELNSALD